MVSKNYIEVNGGKKKKRNLVEEVAWFCILEMMPKMKTLDIEITLENLKGDRAIGFCTMTQDNRTFEIQVDSNLDEENTITTTAHEMVHAYQYATNKEVSEEQAYKLQEVLLHKYNERGKEDGIINSRSNVSGHECVS